MTLLCTRSSNLSHVLVPSPQGDFLVVMLRTLVGINWSLNPESLILRTTNQVGTNLLEILDMLGRESDPDLVDLLPGLLVAGFCRLHSEGSHG
uniref:Uncharacterized protein n=1 Tax=Lotus japonicus TaxID=34305 RepID=I3SL08_LOTJA|nr:unknown [Lotus japonicus]